MQPLLKWLLVLAVVVLGWLWWRQQRLPRRPPAPPPPPSGSATPQPMLRCRHCGVHLPASDAVRGRLGPYCSDEHRRLVEG